MEAGAISLAARHGPVAVRAPRCAPARPGASEAAKALPSSVPSQVKPITIGVGESFTTTLIVVGYFSLLFALPVLIYQLYAFVVPGAQRATSGASRRR